MFELHSKLFYNIEYSVYRLKYSMGEIKQIFREMYNLCLFKVITFDINSILLKTQNRFLVLKKLIREWSITIW